MEINKSNKIAILSLIHSLFRIAAGPVTLIFIASTFTNEEMGFYYVFFGVIGMKMLFEAGMSNVLKVTYSHIKSSNWVATSHLFVFSVVWYTVLSLIIFAFLYFVGNIYFESYSGSVEWSKPWILLCFTTSLLLFISFIEAFLDGTQKQIELKYIQISNSFSVVFLWGALYLDYGLYSLAIMQIASTIITIMIFLSIRKKIFPVKLILDKFSFKEEFSLISNLLHKTFFVWVFGYFFWNGFNLLSFKVLTPEIAGKIGFSLALAKAGYNFASSILVNQMTLIARFISEDNKASIFILKKFLIISVGIMIVGYTLFILLHFMAPTFYIFGKVINIEDLIILFGYFLLIHMFVSLNNYIRAYKVEPFVLLSFCNAIGAILGFYIGIKLELSYFLLPMCWQVVMLIFSYRMFKSYIDRNLIGKNNVRLS